MTKDNIHYSLDLTQSKDKRGSIKPVNSNTVYQRNVLLQSGEIRFTLRILKTRDGQISLIVYHICICLSLL